jgi:hypothetical protein
MGAIIRGVDDSDCAKQAARVARVLGARRLAEDELAQLPWAITAVNPWNRDSIATRIEPA